MTHNIILAITFLVIVLAAVMRIFYKLDKNQEKRSKLMFSDIDAELLELENVNYNVSRKIARISEREFETAKEIMLLKSKLDTVSALAHKANINLVRNK